MVWTCESGFRLLLPLFTCPSRLPYLEHMRSFLFTGKLRSASFQRAYLFCKPFLTLPPFLFTHTNILRAEESYIASQFSIAHHTALLFSLVNTKIITTAHLQSQSQNQSRAKPRRARPQEHSTAQHTRAS